MSNCVKNGAAGQRWHDLAWPQLNKILVAAPIAVFLTGCTILKEPQPPRNEVLGRFMEGNYEVAPELKQTISVCQPMIAHYADRSLMGERAELVVSFSGLFAGVVGAALIAASPANAVWAAGLSAYAGATNAASQKLAGGGLQGEDAGRYRAALVAAVTKEIGLALDSEKTPEQRRLHLYSAQATCALELGPAEMKFGGKLEAPVTPLLNYEDFTGGSEKPAQ